MVISYLYLRMLNSGSLGYKLIFGMIIGGAIGNLIDRAQHSGYVVDFIDLTFWPVFNIADSAICVGVGLLVIDSFVRKEKKAPAAVEPAK